MKHILPVFIFWMCAVQVADACSCIGGRDFITVVTDADYPPDLIVRGVKTSDYYYGMKFRVSEVLQGEASQSEITVWGDNGALCRVYTSGFKKGEELILALYRTDKMGNSISAPEHPDNLEKDGHYVLSVCGTHFLQVGHHQVTGNITTDRKQMDYAEFKMLLGVAEPVPDEGKAFLVYPNPATFGQLKISYHLPNIHALTISLYSVLGNEVKKYQVDVIHDKGILEIDTRDISNGIYFIDLQAKGYRHQEKIIVL